MLQGKRILLCVSGGIAAYKAPIVVRALIKAGAEVRAVLTRSATEFVSPLAIQAVSHNTVGTDLFDPAYEAQIGHIELARWPDAILVAPATANTIAKLALGLCDDLLTTVLCATRAPIAVAPAMNTQMLRHTAVLQNIQTLADRDGVHIIDPDSGELACQEVGTGRMPDPDILLAALEAILSPETPLAGKRVLVTAGPTREALDPVRFLSNPSSGKMGYAIAASAAALGAEVTLVSGPVSLSTPSGVNRVDIVSAEDMFQAVMTRAEDRSAPLDVIVKAAAVADWRPATTADHKMKKTPGQMHIAMERTRDILATLGQLPDDVRPFLVGFAAETQDIERYARDKLARKNLNMIVANDVGGPNGAFGADRSSVFFIDRKGGSAPYGPASKTAIAKALWARVQTLWTTEDGGAP